jgi:diaminohydroxyphosphoribosylaminopyrimidine deaminase / 5-amino-6-(5-phosphoribosylamino)uracil reductase
MEFTDDDRFFMTVALKLAWKAKGTTFPNPAVGAVIVAGRKIVGKGATSFYGGPHAEKIAIEQAGKRAKNATLYVTLEPCNHFGKTPPCTEAIVASGIKTVIFAVHDPNPLVSGRGGRFLKKNGILVYSGLLAEDARRSNEDFFWSITKKSPWITLKLALTLDGRIADGNGCSKWITSKASRAFVHDLRRRHAAVAVGGGTLRNDNPRLSVRYVKGAHPVRIVFSSSPHLPAKSYFIKGAHKIRSIVVANGGGRAFREKSMSGLELWHTGWKTPKENIQSFLSMAYDQGLTSILVEGGSGLASSLLENGFVNRVYFFYGNKLLGKGLDGFSFEKGLPLSRAIELAERKIEIFGDDVMITGIPKRVQRKSPPKRK